MRKPRPSYANVTATLALFLALGGTSYAAISITGSNVQNGTLTGSRLTEWHGIGWRAAWTRISTPPPRPSSSAPGR